MVQKNLLENSQNQRLEQRQKELHKVKQREEFQAHLEQYLLGKQKELENMREREKQFAKAELANIDKMLSKNIEVFEKIKKGVQNHEETFKFFEEIYRQQMEKQQEFDEFFVNQAYEKRLINMEE